LGDRQSFDPKSFEVDFAVDDSTMQGLPMLSLIAVHDGRGDEDQEQNDAEHDEQELPETW